MIKVYIKPFDIDGFYTEFIEVSEDVQERSLGILTEAIDFNEYNTGGIKVSDFSLTVTNTQGRFSDVDGLNSIFRYKRSDSIVKVTWNPTEFSNLCGMAICGESHCGDTEITVFEGILNDDASTDSVQNQTITFQVLGYDSILDRLPLPVSTPAVSQLFSTAIYNILNQAPFNELITVSLSNINPPVDVTFDNVDDFDDNTGKEALDKIYTGANAVMTIRDNVVYVSNRDKSSELKYTFRGQASDIGEDILKISSAKNGLNRTFNYIVWQDTPYFDQETSSVQKYLKRQKIIDFTYLSSQAKIESSLSNILGGLSVPKREFELTTPIYQETMALNLLDWVKVDYPTPLFAPVGDILPVYGITNYGEGKYPYADFNIIIDEDTDWKIITKKVNLKRDTITLKLREE
jgi:hypothetical protein